MNAHVHFLITVEPVTSQASLRGPTEGNPMGQCQNCGVECPEVVIEISPTSVRSGMYCVGLHCCAEGSHLVVMGICIGRCVPSGWLLMQPRLQMLQLFQQTDTH
jgi:hypothetical protein